MRSEWGRQMNALIKPGGYLIALIYPLTATENGPPFYARSEHYREVLGEGWEIVISRTPQDSIRGPFSIYCALKLWGISLFWVK